MMLTKDEREKLKNEQQIKRSFLSEQQKRRLLTLLNKGDRR